MGKYMYYLPILLLFSISCHEQHQTHAQENVIESKNITNGSSKLVKTQGTNEYANVHCGLQDKAGNLWFGTSGEGAYRYDGKFFTNFTLKDGLCNNTVNAMIADQTGHIWIGTDAGLCRYDGKTFTAIPFTENKGAVARKPSAVWSLFQDKEGNMWIGTNNDGVYRYDGTAFVHFLHEDGVENKNGLHLNPVCSMIEDKNGNIWFTTWFEGLCRYDGKAITNFKPNGDIWFSGLFEDKDGYIWVGTRDHGVYRYDGKTFTNYFADIDIFNACSVQAMAEDQSGNLWFATEAGDQTKRETSGGVWRYNSMISTMSGLKDFTNFTIEDGLSHDSVFCITLDQTGKLWFGTRNTGLCSYDGKKFTKYSE